jgi:hypothetical protein
LQVAQVETICRNQIQLSGATIHHRFLLPHDWAGPGGVDEFVPAEIYVFIE